jgi:hypothetical protein
MVYDSKLRASKIILLGNSIHFIIYTAETSEDLYGISSLIVESAPAIVANQITIKTLF